MPLVCDLMRHDQMGLGIDDALNIVADMPTMLRASRHGPRVGVSERYLPVRGIGQRLVYGQQTLDLLADAVISARQMRRPLNPRRAGFLPVNPVSLLDIAADLGFQMRKAAGDLALGEVPVPVVHRFELAPVNGDDLALQNTDAAAEVDELRAGLPDGRTVLPPEICDGLVIWNQPPGQPHHLDIAPGLAFQPAARGDPV